MITLKITDTNRVAGNVLDQLYKILNNIKIRRYAPELRITEYTLECVIDEDLLLDIIKKGTK